jgi:hypothetical protein
MLLRRRRGPIAFCRCSNFLRNLLPPCSSAMQMQIQAKGFSETLVGFYQTTRHHMPEDIVLVLVARISNLKYSSLINEAERNTLIFLCFAFSVETRNCF